MGTSVTPHCSLCLKVKVFQKRPLNLVSKSHISHIDNENKRKMLNTGRAKLHCTAVKRDPNFPLAYAEACNWDPQRLPQVCGQYERRPPHYIFLREFNKRATFSFAGAFYRPEEMHELDKKIPNAFYVFDFEGFKELMKNRTRLLSVANNLIVKLPVDDDEITHEMVWDMIKDQIEMTPTFSAVHEHDWIRGLFHKVGDVRSAWHMSRFGMIPYSSIITIIKDLRNPKYSRGATIDIRPLRTSKRWQYRNLPVGVSKDKTSKAFLEEFYGKPYIRVK